jgi:Tol biopolymer transport system component
VTRSGGVCLVDNRANVHPLAYALLLDERFGVRHRVDLAGFPSRTRMSPDGRYAATTVFTSGDDYEAAFSTRTMLIEHATGKPLPDLEQYVAVRDRKPWKRIDFNYWGVTFPAQGELFFATLRTGDQTFLVRGNRAHRELQVIHEGVECPSVSPDGKRIAFKARQSSGEARIAVLDLDTLEQRTLTGEDRNIDDQVEWLDDEHVLYGVIAERGQPKDAMNVWVARVPASGAPEDREADSPQVFLRAASSPAVVR